MHWQRKQKSFYDKIREKCSGIVVVCGCDVTPEIVNEEWHTKTANVM